MVKPSLPLSFARQPANLPISRQAAHLPSTLTHVPLLIFFHLKKYKNGQAIYLSPIHLLANLLTCFIFHPPVPQFKNTKKLQKYKKKYRSTKWSSQPAHLFYL